ncbi:MAG: response regulator transcription factor [Pedobacter sp.]|nr:MAG: response regulator transcription factor [Pedobacter sp.]
MLLILVLELILLIATAGIFLCRSRKKNLGQQLLLLALGILKDVMKRSRLDSIKISELEKELELIRVDNIRISELEKRVELLRVDNMRFKEFEHELKLIRTDRTISHDTPIEESAIPTDLKIATNEKLSQGELFNLVFRHYRFSSNEIQVVKAFMDGLGPQEAAIKLNLSIKTIESRATSIYKKVGIEDARDGLFKWEKLAKKLIQMSINFGPF